MSDIKNNSNVIFDVLSSRGIIKVTGEDAEKFLQGLITNNIGSEHTIYTMVLTPQGRYLFDLFITKINNEYWCEVDKDSITSLISRLKLYRLRSKVDIEDVSDRYSIYYSHQELDMPKVTSYRDPRFARLGMRTISSQAENENCALYLKDKYNYAIPDGSIDLIRDKSMPQEYGADYLNCIDYHKGCYVGQEVISRTKYQGVVRKKVYKIKASSDISGFIQGDAIMAEGKEIGALCSTYQNLGIGLVRVEEYAKFEGQRFYLNDVEVELAMAEWYK